MRTYEVAELLYQKLDNHHIYAYMVKEFEKDPASFIDELKEVYENSGPRKTTIVEQTAIRILNIIEQVEQESPRLSKKKKIEEIISFGHGIVRTLQELSPIEIVKIIEIVSDEEEDYADYPFHLFAYALSKLKANNYPYIDSLVEMLKKSKNETVRDKGFVLITKSL